MSAFSAANLAILFRTGAPVIDMFTDGVASKAIDEVGDRAAASEIACTEAAEMFGAIKDAARNGVTESAIYNIVAQAKDVAEAKKLLLDPSEIVVLDGVETTADDDVDVVKVAEAKAETKAKPKK